MRGSGRGKEIGTPTMNLNLNDIPQEIEEGIYAGWAQIDEVWCMAAIHYGPRPVFQDSLTFEVHLLDVEIGIPPEKLNIALVERLRDVLNFPSAEALFAQIQRDIEQTRGILRAHGSPDA